MQKSNEMQLESICVLYYNIFLLHMFRLIWTIITEDQMQEEHMW